MAEFAEVMPQFMRLCDSYKHCDDCLVNQAGFKCDYDHMGHSKTDVAGLEHIVMQWAAEHPEPVYPTVAKYLEQFGIIIRRDGTLQADFFKAHEPMNADVAKLLGVDLVEGENEKAD